MENTSKKITKIEYYEMIKDALNGYMLATEQKEEIFTFIDNQIIQLQAKAEKAKERAMKKKDEGDALRDAVFNVLTEEFQGADEIIEQLDGEAASASRAKITARLTQLVRNGKAEKEPQKGEHGRKFMAYRLISAAPVVE